MREHSLGQRKSLEGFTLVELMIVVVILAVLMTVGVPTFRSFIIDQRLRATSNDLRIALMTARSEAVKRNRSIDVTPATDGWTNGWSILDPNDIAILNHMQSGVGDISITGPAVSTPVRFSANGRAVNAIEFEINAGGGSVSTVGCLELALDGRASFTKADCPE